MGAWLSTLVALSSLALSSLAFAAEGRPAVAVLSVEAAAASSAFIESVRIQLTSMASVETGAVLTARTTRGKAGQAHQHLLMTGASIAVWEEQRENARTGRVEVVVLAVTRESPGKPIEVARVATSGRPEDDRVLALKVGELLYQVLSVSKSEKELADALESRGVSAAPARKSEAARTKPRPLPPPLPPPTRFRVFAEGGGGLRVDSRFSNPQVAGKAMLGFARQEASWRVEGGAGARVLTALQQQADNGRLTLGELQVGAGARALLRAGPLSAGVNLELTAAFLTASATALDGREGSATKTAASWLIGPEGRLRLTPQLEMRGLLVLETTLYDQRFSIEGVPVEARTSSHPAAELSLVFWLP